MQLLLLSAGEHTPLPSLEVLAHEVIMASIESPMYAFVSRSGSDGRGDFAPSAILIDGTTSPAAARNAALTLSGRTEIPRVALLRDAALAAITPEWDIADFLTPDASPAEIEVRLRLLIAKAATGETEQPGAVEESGIEIDESNFVAKVHGRTLDLTYKEYELLHFLALNPARVFTREQLLADVWGSDYFGGTRTVDVHVRRLRAKLGEHEWLISTVRGVGYGFARGRQEEED
ncbi:winged helix-turn-helix domain-containing protein [Leucobacter denitrificans]|uniref:Winged helix-turn-helix transcriptional regulator n=1 Tax=Leucobacter denitrificans TaxID=683042 RepID=A0A7G9S3S2_9MICO|nr:winged helix-turn-helix domain-containing protein [Leucobacter denitrificans]QNN62497.1 winged helix-turn-helix transcriptional regulator [Leucobacter denitrificans]